MVRTKWMARQFKNHLSIVKDALFSGVFRGQKSRHGILLYRHLCKSYGGKGIGKFLNGKKMSFYIWGIASYFNVFLTKPWGYYLYRILRVSSREPYLSVTSLYFVYLLYTKGGARLRTDLTILKSNLKNLNKKSNSTEIIARTKENF